LQKSPIKETIICMCVYMYVFVSRPIFILNPHKHVLSNGMYVCKICVCVCLVMCVCIVLSPDFFFMSAQPQTHVLNHGMYVCFAICMYALLYQYAFV